MDAIAFEQNMFRLIKEQLAPPSTGTWFQELERRFTKAGEPVWKLTGKPVVSLDYWRLLGYEDLSELPQRRMDVVDKAHRFAVEKEIYLAMNDQNQATHECTFRVICPQRDNKRSIRWILARASRMEREGKTYLACWNTDITALREREAFFEKVLATIPGFVFMKEFEEGKNGGIFRFKYCNERLQQELKRCLEAGHELRTTTDFYKDKTDYDFFPIEQADNFRRNDMKAFNAGGEQITIAEEQFTPQAQDPNSKTLTTVKVRFDTVNPDGSESHCVLGVAIDLSSVMQLLHAAVDACNDAIFIKDAEQRYVYVNQPFRNFIGVDNSFVIEGKTFREVQEMRYPTSNPYRLKELMNEVEQDDAKLIQSGQNIMKEQLAFYSDKKVWQLEKRRIGVKEKGFHVLGVARHKLDPQRINTQIIKNSPQFICIKDANLRVIHCNWNFAQRRNRPIEECFNKTDFDFWPEDKFPGQAARFQERDREVLKLLPLLEALERDILKSDSEKQRARRLILRAHTSYEEYIDVEEIQPNGEARILRRHIVTTKWPDRMNGEPVIHVLYADDTEAKIQLKEAVNNLQTWHRYTIHAIGNEMAPFMGALLETRQLLTRIQVGALQLAPDIQRLYNKLAFGKHAMDFYVNHHLKFISGKCDLTAKVSIGNIVKAKISEFEDIEVPYALFEGHEIEPATCEQTTDADEVFVKAAVTEMLRNALKALERRYGEGFRLSSEHAESGVIRVTCRLRRTAGRIKQPCIVISVRDNGDGSVAGSEAQRKLQAGFHRVYSEQFDHSHEFGMRFLHSVAKGHGGELNLDAKDGQAVEFHLVIPLKHITSSHDTKEPHFDR